MPLQTATDTQQYHKHYRLRQKSIDGYVYMEIRKGMYSLPQAASLPTNFSNSVSHAMDTLNNAYAWPLETLFTTHLVQPVGGQLRHQIYW
jgi:hypothetical protein